jgi:hypothetical protein
LAEGCHCKSSLTEWATGNQSPDELFSNVSLPDLSWGRKPDENKENIMNKIRVLALFVFLTLFIAAAGAGQAAAAGSPAPVTLTEGTASFSQGDWCCNLNVDEAVDGQLYDYDASGTYNGWAIYNVNSSDPQTAVWETSSEVNASQLDFNLYHTFAAAHSLGRFRLSYTTDDRSQFADGLNTSGDVTANWIVLTGATVSGTGGESFTELGDNSILGSGPAPATSVYSVSFAGSFTGITGIRLEALADPSLPDSGPGRAGNGNFHLVEITLDATPPPDAIVQFDATMLSLLNGQTVTTWGGQNAAGNPTYLENQTPNGMPAVEFNSGGDRMGNNILLSPSAAADWIVVAVIKPTNIGDYHNLVDDDASNRPMLWIDPGFRYELNFGGGSGAMSAGTGTDGWDIVIADSRLNQLYVNSPTPNATGRSAIPFAAAESFDFFHRDGLQTFQGLVAELRIYNDRADFGGDFAALHSEMYAKWIETSVMDSDGDGVPDDDDAFPNDPDRTVSCLAGYYGATSCTPAPPGKFVAADGALTAELCLMGTFSNQLASIACTPAPAGSFVDVEGATAANLCSLGHYQTATGAVTCIAAPIGSYVDSVGAAAATACPAGSTTIATASTSLSDCNFPPTADAGGPYLVAVGAGVNFDGSSSSDPDGDSLAETWMAGGGTVTANVYTAGTGPGIYDVQLVVNDGTVDSPPATTIVVVYDPSGGFVTGGGWINSPAGAYTADESLSGKATFGFVAKYKKGANVPDGNTEFQFKAGDLNFKSGSYEWLVVAGNKAQFKGEGTINGQGSYQFMISADDDTPDTFRIQIWGDNGTVYDNGSQQALDGGSIVIHNSK